MSVNYKKREAIVGTGLQIVRLLVTLSAAVGLATVAVAATLPNVQKPRYPRGGRGYL